MNNRGRLFLIPAPLGGNDPREVIPAPVLTLLRNITTFVVEETRTARRYLSAAGLKGSIGELEFHELNEHTLPSEVDALLQLFESRGEKRTDGRPVGNDVGLICEAGLPAVADPGSQLVARCHAHGIEVIPLAGPSSLMLALMASGLNGQSFAFCGYLPVKTEERRKIIREIERRSAQLNQTQLFIETPYRNDALMSDLVSTLSPGTLLCFAADLTLPTQTIRTRTAGEWRSASFDIGKRPCVFLLLASSNSEAVLK